MTKKRKVVRKNGTRCCTCDAFVQNPDSHAKKHKEEWLKENKNKRPIPAMKFEMIVDGEVTGSKVL